LRSYLVKLQFLKQATGAQKSSAISCSIVLKSNCKSMFFELTRICGANYLVSNNLSLNHLNGHIFVRKANNETVFWRLVFVLVLCNELVSLAVISMT